MRVLGLTSWLNSSLSLQRPIGSLEPDVAVTITHNDTHTRTHTSITNVQHRMQSVKFECPSHCKPEITLHKSKKVQFSFLCKSNFKVEFCDVFLN